MRTAFAYTSARILMFGVSVIVLYMAGARGILLLGLGLVISALGSYILLNKQRQVIAAKLNGRLSRVGAKATDFRGRLEAGATAEDEAEAEDAAEDGAEEAPAEPSAIDTEPVLGRPQGA
jgi:UPF0716 family protein affecting phage T7 exclusion